MAIALNAATATVGASTTLAITLPAGILGGQCIRLDQAWNNGGTGVTMGVPAGFTVIDTVTVGSASLRTLYKVAAGVTGAASADSSSSVTSTLSTSKAWVAEVRVYTGTDTSNPVHANAAGGPGGTGTTHTAPTVTVTVANCWIEETACERASSTALTKPAGFTLRATAGPQAVTSPVVGSSADSNGTVATGTRGGDTWTGTAVTANFALATVALQPPVGSGGGPVPRATAAGTANMPTVTGTITVYGQGPATSIGRAILPTVLGSTVAALVATAEPDNVPPRVRIDIDGAPGSTVTVTRTGPDGKQVPVRTGDPAALTFGSAVLYDYEAPYNQPCFYTAGNAVSGVVTLESAQSWLVHAGIPSLSQPVTGLGPMPDESRAATAGVHYVTGRALPIVITDGVRKGPVFGYTFMTVTAVAEVGFRALILDLSPLLAQLVDNGVSTYRWISVGDVTVGHPGVFADPARTWSADCVEVDRPIGGVQSQRTYADILNGFDSYAAVLSAYTSYRAVLTGIAAAAAADDALSVIANADETVTVTASGGMSFVSNPDQTVSLILGA